MKTTETTPEFDLTKDRFDFEWGSLDHNTYYEYRNIPPIAHHVTIYIRKSACGKTTTIHARGQSKREVLLKGYEKVMKRLEAKNVAAQGI